MNLPKQVFNCKISKTLVHFNYLCNLLDAGDSKNRVIIRDSECFNNGKIIADWTVNKINIKYPEYTAKRTIDSPLIFYIDKLFGKTYSNSGYLIKLNLK